jgi:hypothetical protein
MVDLGHGGIGLCCHLRPAARDHDPRLGPLPPQPADRLPCLPVGLGRHRTGMDDDGIA